MSTHKIIKELIDENLIGAKKEINDLLYEKLGDHLNEMYVEIAPTLLGEAKKKKKKKKKGAKPDFLDLDGDGDKEEPMKDAADDKEQKGMKEEYSDEEPMGEGGKTPQGADNLRPDGAPKDEPGDLSSKKKEILAAVGGKSSGAATSGDAY